MSETPNPNASAELRAGVPGAEALPEAVLARLLRDEARLRAQAAEELVELYNLTWRDGLAPVAESEFAAALQLVAIDAEREVLRALRYTAPALLGPATVVLYADAADGSLRACIEA